MNCKKFSGMIPAIALIALILPAAALAAPSVEIECAYTNEGATANAPDLACEVFLINPEAVKFLSAGVSLIFDAGKLAIHSGVGEPIKKNTTDWYFGDDPPGEIYMDPEVSVDGSLGRVTYIVGNFDTNALGGPGVNKARIKVGEARFERKPDAPDGTSYLSLSGDQQAHFGIGAELGRSTETFVNFVNAAGAPLDSGADAVVFSAIPTVVRRGDANADGIINGADRSAVTFYIRNGGIPHVWMDCNDDLLINGADRSCVTFIIRN